MHFLLSDEMIGLEVLASAACEVAVMAHRAPIWLRGHALANIAATTPTA